MIYLTASIALLFLTLNLYVWLTYFKKSAWDKLTSKKVIVNLSDGFTIEGVLISRKGLLLEIGNAWITGPNLATAKADGIYYIERSKVLWIATD